MKNSPIADEIQDSLACEARKPYIRPRIEKRQSIARVTLATGSGTTGVGVISTIN